MLLFPYYATLKVRNALYDKGVKKSQRAEVPTICVGNVTAGGTGKTPHTEMIIRMLLESYEWGNKNIAVLSRGYQRESKGFQQVPVDGSAIMFGDEPIQIKKRFPQITVAVDNDRIEGCDYLCHPEKLREQPQGPESCWDKDFPPADLIILDDAFQYRRLKASLNVVLVDYNRPVTRDHLLPMGSLRDIPERMYDSDVVIVTKCPYTMDKWERTAYADELGYHDYRSSTGMAVAPNGKPQLLLFSAIEYGEFVPIFEESDTRFRFSKRLILFSGIALDSPLHSYLSDKYKIIRKFSFPDHHKYTWSDFDKIRKAVQQFPTAAIATTEKDTQRVLDYNGLGVDIRQRMFMIPIKVDFMDSAEREIFRKRLLGVGQTIR